MIEYVIQSGDDKNLIAFLKSKRSGSNQFQTSSHLLRLQNEQFKKVAKKSLFQHYLEHCEKFEKSENDDDNQNTTYDFMVIIKTLVEDIGTIMDIEKTIPIGKWLENKKRSYYLDCLMATILENWTKEDPNFKIYKKTFDDDPRLRMFIDILDGRPDDFIANFKDNREELEGIIKTRYETSAYKSHVRMSNFYLCLLYCAMKNNQTKIIDHIFEVEDFQNLEIRYPSNMKCNETSYYVAKKFLETGWFIGNDELPQEWLEKEHFKEFLDSRITANKNNMIEIDTRFLLHPQTRKYQLRSAEDIDYKLIMWEDVEALEYIKESPFLKDLIDHPVISTYIELKTLKHRPIYILNLTLFLLLFVVFFPAFILIDHSIKADERSGRFYLLAGLCVLSLVILISREVFQFKFVERDWKEYFKKVTNWLESGLILVSITNLFCIFLKNNPVVAKYCLPISTIFNIFLIIITFLTMLLPFSGIAIFLMMVKRIGKTLLSFLIFLVMIFAAFIMSFYVLFSKEALSDGSHGIGTDTEGDPFSNSTNTEKDPDPFSNFDNSLTAIVKTIMMLTGEFTIEPHTIYYNFTLVFFLFFILCSVALLNLILGLMIDDVQKLRVDATKVNLALNIDQFISTSNVCYKVYKKYFTFRDRIKTDDVSVEVERNDDGTGEHGGNDAANNGGTQNEGKKSCFFACLERLWIKISDPFIWFFVWLLVRLVSTQPFLHKIDKVNVDWKTRKISVIVNRKRENIKYLLNMKRARVSREACDKIIEILSARKKQNIENSSDSDFKNDVKSIAKTLRDEEFIRTFKALIKPRRITRSKLKISKRK